MGCPKKHRQRCRAAINEPNLVHKSSTRRADGIDSLASRVLAGDYKTFPLSIKNETWHRTPNREWIEHLLCDIDALTIHGRTAKEMSKGPVHWDEIGKAVKLSRCDENLRSSSAMGT
jgi:tRNA-dihydrouridine synthase